MHMPAKIAWHTLIEVPCLSFATYKSDSVSADGLYDRSATTWEGINYSPGGGGVSRYLSGIDDAHVHAGPACVVQECRVEGPPHRLVAPEGEGHVGDPPADLAARADVLDDLGGADEVYRVAADQPKIFSSV